MTVMDRFDLTGTTALVTGSTKGLGRAFAHALAEAGANLVIVGRDADAAHQVRSEVNERGAEALIALGDVTAREDLEMVRDAAIDAFGAVDVLVNNAGTCIHRPALEVTDDEWHEVMDVNVDAVWMASQVFGREMVARGRGVIVNIASMSGLVVNRPQWQPAYNASKAAVIQLTKSLAAEWAPHGVRVNALAPGYMRTEMAPVDEPQFQRHWIEDAPLGRCGEPDELGPAMVFLASDASSFMTGSTLVVDGGYTVF